MDSPATIIVFPGQGSQRSAMGRDFHENFAAARMVYEESSEALGLDLDAICFGTAPRLRLTEFAQPAILATEIAILRALEAETDLAVAAWGGHSLGEYTALVASGALPLAAALRIVRIRGRLMQEAAPVNRGRMVAVIGPNLDLETIASTIADLEVDIANDNSSEQVVLSGLADDTRVAERRLIHMASRLVALDVSAPFHSRLMAGTESAFAPVLHEEATGVLDAARAAAVTANASGGFHDPDPGEILDSLVRQVSSTVRWRSNMDALLTAGTRVLEIGPSAPLRGFFRTLGVAVETITNVRALSRLASPCSQGSVAAMA
jgi:[acyl-carrier-protein] S-malonyltransferase